jgi:hypothetical protein
MSTNLVCVGICQDWAFPSFKQWPFSPKIVHFRLLAGPKIEQKNGLDGKAELALTGRDFQQFLARFEIVFT